jgi:MFS family permease
MRSDVSTRPDAARLCALSAGIQLIWGAVLAVSLQERSIALAGRGNAIGLYAMVAAAGALIATVAQLLAGASSDAVRRSGGSRAGFYAAGVALALPALGWFYLAPDFAQLVAAFFALQAALNIVGGPYQAIIPDYIEPGSRGRAAGWMSAYQSLGNAAGLVIAAFVHNLTIVAACLGAPLVLTWAVTAAHARRLSPAAHAPGASPRLSLRGPLGALLLSRGAINVGFYTLLGFLLFFVRDALGVRGSAVETQTGLVFLTFTAAAIGGAVLGAGPADRFDKRLVVTSAVAFIVAALALLAVASNLPAAYAAAAAAGAAWGAFVSADWALATALLPTGSMATAMGVWNVATTLPQVIAPVLAAPLVLRANALHAGAGPRAAIALALLEFTLGGALVWRLPRA